MNGCNLNCYNISVFNLVINFNCNANVYSLYYIVYRPTLHIILCSHSLEFIIQNTHSEVETSEERSERRLKFLSMKTRSSNIISSTMREFILHVSSQ